MKIIENPTAEFSYQSRNNIDVDDSFEKLLMSDDFNKRKDNSINNEKLFVSNDIFHSDGQSVEKQLEQPKLNTLGVHNLYGIGAYELYEQKQYAIGKLSYINKRNSASIYEPVKFIKEENISLKARENNEIFNRFRSVLSSNKGLLNSNLSTLFEFDHFMQGKLSKDVIASANPAYKFRFSREKITQSNSDGRAFLYIRNYFSSSQEINEIVYQFVHKFKSKFTSKIKIIVNGNRGGG